MKEYGTTAALKVFRKKVPSLSPITIKEWGKEGVIKGRWKKRGIFKQFLIPENELKRIYSLLPSHRVIGKPLLPK